MPVESLPQRRRTTGDRHITGEPEPPLSLGPESGDRNQKGHQDYPQVELAERVQSEQRGERGMLSALNHAGTLAASEPQNIGAQQKTRRNRQAVRRCRRRLM